MPKAIVTKFIPGTVTRGSRIKANSHGSTSLTVGYAPTLEDSDNHVYAATSLCKKHGWNCEGMRSAPLPNGNIVHMINQE